MLSLAKLGKNAVVLLFMLCPAGLAFAGVDWGITGDNVKGGGTLAAENLDSENTSYARLVFSRPYDGYKYLAVELSAKNGAPSVQCGINEKGLAVLSADAPVNKEEKNAGKKDLCELILRNYFEVNSVIEDKEKLSEYAPGSYMIADKSNVVQIEIVPGGKYRITGTMNGKLCHTSEYLEPEFSAYNKAVSTGSVVRRERINGLMGNSSQNFGLDDFITISEDQHDGPDNSLWVSGKSKTSERTLATFIVLMPGDAPPTLYIKTANTNQKMKSAKLLLDRKFWHNQNEGEISF